MKIQACQVKRAEDAKWEPGIAKVKSFGTHDVEWIVTSDGRRITKPWDYKLIDAPFSHLQTRGK